MSDVASEAHGRSETRMGVAYAVAAYGLWGFYGLFFKLMAHIDPLEVVAHRAFWSIPIAGGLLVAMGSTGDVGKAMASPPVLGKLVISSFLVAVSWGFFVWAIAVGRTLEASLGYYINPLLNVIIGFALLGERFTLAQKVAIGLAIVAVAVLTVEAGVFPWLAFLLAGSFAAYGYMRKTIAVGAVQGFFVESLLLSALGILIVAWLAGRSANRFSDSLPDTLLLIACGPMTALPLMLFAAAARRLRFSTVGILQYIAPTGLFLTAVFAFGEPIGPWRLMAFVLIWTALAVYTAEALRAERHR
jgi:chloramphenicol-sensitive protein RarD